MMNSQKLAGIGLALGVAFSGAACTTTGSVIPRVINTTEIDETNGSCVVTRERGFDPGILPFIKFGTKDMTQRDSACITRDTVQLLVVEQDDFLRTIGYEMYQLLPSQEQERVQQFLVLNNTNIENIAASVPRIDETITDCENGQIRIIGHMPDGQHVVRVRPIDDGIAANQNAALNSQSPPPVCVVRQPQ